MHIQSKYTTKLSLFFVSFILFLLTACGGSVGISGSATNLPVTASQGTPKASYEQQILHVPSYTPDLATLDPAAVHDIASIQAVSMVFNGLVRLNSNSQIQPELAESWQQSSNGLLWTFHLRPHLVFSDGTALTSQDIAYSIDRACEPKFADSEIPLKDVDKRVAGHLKTLIGDSILTPDAMTVILVAKQKMASFLLQMTAPTTLVVEKHLVATYGDEKFTNHLSDGGGAGPFVVSRYVHRQEIDFAPNPYYYNLKPFLQKIVLRFFTDTAASFQAYQRGELDYTVVPIANFDDARQLTNEFVQRPTLSTSGVNMNFLSKPFDNIHIRQAFALAVNREVVNMNIFHGAEIPSYHLILQGVAGYNLNLTGVANVKDTRGDVSLAKQLFQQGIREEGWSDSSQIPSIKFTYAKGTNGDKLYAALSKMWKDAFGITVQPAPIDFNMLVEKEHETSSNPNGLQMWLSTYGFSFPDPLTQLDGYESGNFVNYGQNTSSDSLQEQAVQQQLLQGDAELNPTTRLLLYQAAEQQLVNQVAFLPLLQNTTIVLIKPYVQGAVVPLTFTFPMGDWTNIYISQH